MAPENGTAGAAAALDFYEVVRFASADPEYAEVNGLTGYVAGKGEIDDGTVALFFYDIEGVWIVPAASCTSLGRIDRDVEAHFAGAREQIEKKQGNDDAQG